MMSFLVCISIIEKGCETMIIVGAAGLISGAYSRVTIELISVYSTYDAEVAKIQREDRKGATQAKERTVIENLPRPWQVAGTFVLSSAMGSLVPLLGAAFIKDRQLRWLEVMVVSSIALVSLGALSAKLNNLPPVKSVSRLLLEGYFTISVAYCTTKLIG
ncbi:vacuolar iron transporter homolog 1-like [Eucalyptus grandis]|uniref:vacuolar iron transporter homolog 1-like n=1 Tax=Eucalyptus grandis TaxID=71139 RepID=UPI00192E8885|nr:vacuolar iron transporter homolog 1-like [Eucalyptus grandis]